MDERAIFATITNTSPQLSWNLFDDIAALFHYEFMVHAFEAGTIVAIVAGAIGYFVVLRGSAFAAHALSHIGFAGATGAVVLAVTSTWSPCRTPASRSAAAVAATWAAAAPKVIVPSSVRIHTPSGSRRAASARTWGIVRCAASSMY